MKIGIDVRPMLGQRAGIGYYVWGLLSGLAEIDKVNQYYLFSNKDFRLPFANLNFHKVILRAPFWHLRVVWEVKRKKLDLYHSTHSFIVPAILGGRTILTFHDASAFKFAQTHTLKVRFLTLLLMRFALFRTKRIIVPSESTRKDVIRIASAKKGKVVVIPEAVDDYFVTSRERDVVVKAKYELPHNYLFFNATLEPRKNIYRLLEAHQLLKGKYGLEVTLVLAGKRGWNFDETVLNKKGVKWLGWVPENALPSLYRLASLFVYPSLYEGFGLSVLKAFKMETPVLTSNVSSLPEVANGAAILVDPNNTEEIARQMAKILKDKSLAKEMIEKGREWVKNFTWEKAAHETLKVYYEAG